MNNTSSCNIQVANFHPVIQDSRKKHSTGRFPRRKLVAAESVLFYLQVNLVLCLLANCIVSTEVISARKNRNGDLSMIV